MQFLQKNSTANCVLKQIQDTNCIETKKTRPYLHWNQNFNTQNALKRKLQDTNKCTKNETNIFKTKIALKQKNQDNKCIETNSSRRKLHLKQKNQDKTCTWNIFKCSKSPIIFRERSCQLHTSWQHRRRYLHTSWQHRRHTYVVAAQAPLEKGSSFRDVLWFLGRSYGHTDPF